MQVSVIFTLSRRLFCRYIVHSDDHNPYLTSMEEFAAKLGGFTPDLVVVGGLQMMDNFPFQSGTGKVDLNSFVPPTLLLQFKLWSLTGLFANMFHVFTWSVVPNGSSRLSIA